MSPFCTSDATGEDVDVTRAAVASSLSEALAARDRYDVQAGNYSFFFLKDCATYDLDSCFALNADSPYGMTFLPDAPGQAEYDGCVADGGACGLGCNPNDNPDLDTKICYDGKTMKWLLGEDDAVVVLMEAPPECKYWSVTYYQMSKYYADEAGLRSEEPDSFESELQEKASECADPPARCQTFASLGSPINYLDLEASNGVSGFRKPLAIVMTASKSVDREIQSILSSEICSSGSLPIFSAPLPYDLLTLGLDSQSDVLTMLLRTAYPNNATEMSQFYADAPVSVLRVTSRQRTNEPNCDTHFCLSDVVFKKRGDGTMESGGDELTSEQLLAGLDELGAAIELKHGQAKQNTVFLMPYFDTGLDCIEGGIMCQGDCPDTLYPVSENVYDAEFCDVVSKLLLPLGSTGAAVAAVLGFVIYWLAVRKRGYARNKFWGIGAIYSSACFVVVFVPILVVYLNKAQCSHYATIDSGPGDFYVAYGVNHKATGHATYSSINAYHYETLAGVAAASSESTPGFDGSAQAYLGNDNPAAKYLYAYHFARNCSESGLGEYCLDVPSSGDVSLPPGERIMFIGRMYIDPKTGAGPKANETIYDNLKHYY